MAFSNRIVKYGEKPADQFQANPNNWRQHPKRQREALSASLRGVGWVGPVIENIRTGHLLDGHERVWQALQSGDSTPVPYIQVDVSEDEELLVLATFDPITQMAVTDADMLEAILADLQTSELVQEDAALDKLLREISSDTNVLYGEGDSNYSREIEAPIYEPTGEKPEIGDLFDDSRTKVLIEEINAADLDEEVKGFLRIAAQRHTVLDFSKIAEFYAHATEDLQILMENSALVVIDFDRAIELGFVRVIERFAKLYAEDYGDV